MSNSESTVRQGPIAQALAAIVFGQRPSVPIMHAVTTPQGVLESYAGRYHFGPDLFTPDEAFTLSARPGYLLMQIGDSRRPLIPLQSGEFLERKYFARVVMQKDDNGKVTGLTIRYGSKEFAASNLASE